MKLDSEGNSLFEIGDVCRLEGKSFLWVPFMKCISRRGEVAMHEEKFRFAQFPGAKTSVVEHRNCVESVYMKRDREQAMRFWNETLAMPRPASMEYAPKPEPHRKGEPTGREGWKRRQK